MKQLKFIFLIFSLALLAHACKDACDDIDCGVNGTCVDGTCICDDGFLGINCQTRICDTVDCGANGTCDPVTGDCLCDTGYSGTNCEVNVCDTVNCGDNGTCDTATGDCICNEGYEGDNCDTEVREKHYGNYIGDMTSCVPAILGGLIPADALASLEMTEIVVRRSETGVTFVEIASTSDIIGFSIDADTTAEDFEVPEFSQEVTVGAFDVTVVGSGTGRILDEDNVEISLDLEFQLPLAQATSECTIVFNKQ